MDDFYINLGRLIKESRLERNLTTQELANILNVSLGFLSNLENAKTDTFNTELMLGLHKALDISLLNFLPISNNDLWASNLSLSDHIKEATSNMPDLLSNNINSLINTYIDTIKKHNFDPNFIDKITDKLIKELNYIDEFKL